MSAGLRNAMVIVTVVVVGALSASPSVWAQTEDEAITLTQCYELLDHGQNLEVITRVQEFLATSPPAESQRIALEYSLEAHFREGREDQARPLIRAAADLTENGDWQPVRFADWPSDLRALVVNELDELLGVYSNTFEVFALEVGGVEISVASLSGKSPLKIGEEGAMGAEAIAEMAIRKANQYFEDERPRNAARELQVQTLRRSAENSIEAHGSLKVTIDSYGSQDKVFLSAQFYTGSGRDCGSADLHDRRIRNERDLVREFDRLMRAAAKAVWDKERRQGERWDQEMLQHAERRRDIFRDYHAALTARDQAWEAEDNAGAIAGLESVLVQLETLQSSSALFQNSIRSQIEIIQADLDSRRPSDDGASDGE